MNLRYKVHVHIHHHYNSTTVLYLKKEQKIKKKLVFRIFSAAKKGEISTVPLSEVMRIFER